MSKFVRGEYLNTELEKENAALRARIAELEGAVAQWHATALETASLRGVLIEFWEATAKNDRKRLESAKTRLVATMKNLVARKAKGELV